MKTKIQKYTLWSLMAALLMLSAQSGASVWEHDREWGVSDDLAFSRWVSRSVKTTFFKDLGGSYKYLRLDCADALYGLRIYFAAKNRISFSARKGKITNEMDRYDHIQNEDRRIAKFIAYVAGQIGTETMAHNDTYSVSIRSLRPGDLFMYKYTTNGTSYTRHSYIIKNINVDGTFDVLYSTQARRDSGRPMARVRHESFQHKPLHYGSNKYGWGFRRWKRPSQAHLNQSQIADANFDQYRLARQLSEYRFFRYVQNQLKRISESPDRLMNRHFETVCGELKSRRKVVKDAQAYLARIGGRCMDEGEYDKYSTPSRDGGIRKKYKWFRLAKEEIQKKGKFSQVHEEMRDHVITVFKSQRSQSKQQALFEACPVRVGQYKINMGYFWDALRNKWASFHPNDNQYLRWGIQRGTPTSCKAYY